MRFIALALAVAMTAGCATVDTPQAGRGGATFDVRGKTYDEVWRAATATVSRSLTIVENSKDTGTIRAEKSAGLTTWGEVVGVFVRPATPGAKVYTVEVQSIKRSTLQITGQDWSLTIISGIKAELGL